MEQDHNPTLVFDTSVLINFLAVGRMDLLALYPARCIVTDHVRGEILDHYQERFQRFQTALNNQTIEELRVDRPAELLTFVELRASGRLGYGECSAIALATHREFELAIDDRQARNAAKRLAPSLKTHTTQEIMLFLIRLGTITVEAADQIKDTWATEHRFRLKIASFHDLL